MQNKADIPAVKQSHRLAGHQLTIAGNLNNEIKFVNNRAGPTRKILTNGQVENV